jgi:hypothetical protein
LIGIASIVVGVWREEVSNIFNYLLLTALLLLILWRISMMARPIMSADGGAGFAASYPNPGPEPAWISLASVVEAVTRQHLVV